MLVPQKKFSYGPKQKNTNENTRPKNENKKVFALWKCASIDYYVNVQKNFEEHKKFRVKEIKSKKFSNNFPVNFNRLPLNCNSSLHSMKMYTIIAKLSWLYVYPNQTATQSFKP